MALKVCNVEARPARKLPVSIARVGFMLHCSDLPLLPEPLAPSYYPFACENGAPESGSFLVDICLQTGALPAIEGFTEVFEGNGSWSMFRKDSEYYVVLNPLLPDGPECVARFDVRSERAILYCGKRLVVEEGGSTMLRNPFTYPLDQLLFVHMLVYREGALLHALGADFEGRGYLFPGRSGAGKSTISRHLMLKGHRVLSDDRIALRKIDGEFMLYGTPWSGEAAIAVNAGLPLKGVFFIRQWSDNRIDEISPREAARRLMPVASIPWFDREGMTAVLAFCEDLVSNVPAYEFSFTPGVEAAEFLEKFISG